MPKRRCYGVFSAFKLKRVFSCLRLAWIAIRQIQLLVCNINNHRPQRPMSVTHGNCFVIMTADAFRMSCVIRQDSEKDFNSHFSFLFNQSSGSIKTDERWIVGIISCFSSQNHLHGKPMVRVANCFTVRQQNIHIDWCIFNEKKQTIRACQSDTSASCAFGFCLWVLSKVSENHLFTTSSAPRESQKKGCQSSWTSHEV